jgi:hypothetical protein
MMLEWISNNEEWLFSGIGGAVVISVVGFFLRR